MIKYNTQLGAKHLNSEARELKDALKPYLSGMHCTKCTTDTIINFVDDGHGHLTRRIHACCKDFELRILQKITFD